MEKTKLNNKLERPIEETVSEATPQETVSDYSTLAETVNVKVIKNSKHLKAGDVHSIGKETAIILLKQKLVEVCQ